MELTRLKIFLGWVSPKLQTGFEPVFATYEVAVLTNYTIEAELIWEGCRVNLYPSPIN